MPTLTFHRCTDTKLFLRVMQSILAAGTLAVMVTGEDDLTHRSPELDLVRIFVELGELHGEQFEKPLAASVITVGDSSLMALIWFATTLSQDRPPMKLFNYELTRFAVLMVMARASICGQLALVIQSLVNN